PPILPLIRVSPTEQQGCLQNPRSARKLHWETKKPRPIVNLRIPILAYATRALTIPSLLAHPFQSPPRAPKSRRSAPKCLVCSLLHSQLSFGFLSLVIEHVTQPFTPLSLV